MNRSAYASVSAIVFSLVAIGHGYRAAMAIPMQLGTHAVPVWGSWVGALIAALLAIWGFRSRG